MNNEGGGYFTSTTGTSGSQDQQRRENTLRPTTIRQLNNAVIASDGSNALIDGKLIGRVSVVAKILKINKQETQTHYTLEDGTGSIGVKQWNNSSGADFGMGDDQDQESKLSGPDSVKDGEYAYFFCRCSPFNNKVAYVVDAVRPVTDCNEVAYHLVSALYAHMYEKKELKLATKSAQNSNSNSSSLFIDGNGAAGNAYDMEIRKQVVDLLKSHSNNEDGVPFAALKQACRFDRRSGHRSDEQVLRDVLSTLCDQGSVYPTSADCYAYCL